MGSREETSPLSMKVYENTTHTTLTLTQHIPLQCTSLLSVPLSLCPSVPRSLCPSAPLSSLPAPHLHVACELHPKLGLADPRLAAELDALSNGDPPTEHAVDVRGEGNDALLALLRLE